MGAFRKLRVWQEARDLTRLVYRAAAGLPASERYGLALQMKKSSVSIMANIAEGCGRNRKTEFQRFLGIASGSATELECHLVVCEDQGFLEPPRLSEAYLRIDRVQRMLAGLIRKLPNE